MELLIPGLILVALMVYASTRIKRSAAEAFAAENIDGGDFTLEKPEGFLAVVNGRKELEFEAYSREFGTEEAENIRQARIEIRRLPLSGARKEKGALVEVVDGRRYVTSETSAEEKGNALREITKQVKSDDAMLELKVLMLAETTPEIARNIETMLASFRLKENSPAIDPESV